MIYSLDSLKVTLIGNNHFIAQNAAVVGDVTLNDWVSVWFSASIRGDLDSITIGQGSNVQESVSLHTDPGSPINIGERVTIAHGAMIHGCTIGNDSAIGIGATVLNGAKIGSRCLVGANTLVTANTEVPDGSLIVGSPGKVVRKLEQKELDYIDTLYNYYIKLLTRYKEGLKPDSSQSQ